MYVFGLNTICVGHDLEHSLVSGQFKTVASPMHTLCVWMLWEKNVPSLVHRCLLLL